MHPQSDEPKPLIGTPALGIRRTLAFVRHSPERVQGQTQIRRRLATSRK
jgi:hypothetical protein